MQMNERTEQVLIITYCTSLFYKAVQERIWAIVFITICWHPVFTISNCVTVISDCKSFPFIQIHRFQAMELYSASGAVLSQMEYRSLIAHET